MRRRSHRSPGCHRRTRPRFRGCHPRAIRRPRLASRRRRLNRHRQRHHHSPRYRPKLDRPHRRGRHPLRPSLAWSRPFPRRLQWSLPHHQWPDSRRCQRQDQGLPCCPSTQRSPPLPGRVTLLEESDPPPDGSMASWMTAARSEPTHSRRTPSATRRCGRRVRDLVRRAFRAVWRGKALAATVSVDQHRSLCNPSGAPCSISS
jgi:hypothetical protein